MSASHLLGLQTQKGHNPNLVNKGLLSCITYLLWREETFLNAFRKEKLACSTGFWDICFLLNGYHMGYTLAIGVFWVMTLWSQKHWSLRFIRFSAWKLGLSIYLLEFFFCPFWRTKCKRLEVEFEGAVHFLSTHNVIQQIFLSTVQWHIVDNTI